MRRYMTTGVVRWWDATGAFNAFIDEWSAMRNRSQADVTILNVVQDSGVVPHQTPAWPTLTR